VCHTVPRDAGSALINTSAASVIATGIAALPVLVRRNAQGVSTLRAHAVPGQRGVTTARLAAFISRGQLGSASRRPGWPHERGVTRLSRGARMRD
jgi:hypothetical protein